MENAPGLQSGRRRDYSRRPPTPPAVRFRNGRFLSTGQNLICDSEFGFVRRIVERYNRAPNVFGTAGPAEPLVGPVSLRASASRCESTRDYPLMTGSALRPARAELIWPLLTSGSPSQHLSVSIAHGKLPDLPGYDALTVTLMPVGSTSQPSVQVLGFASIGLLTPLRRLYPLPVRRASALPTASSRFHLTMDTLAVQLTLPLAGRVEDFHLQVSAPCRAHQRKSPEPISGLIPTTELVTKLLPRSSCRR